MFENKGRQWAGWAVAIVAWLAQPAMAAEGQAGVRWGLFTPPGGEVSIAIPAPPTVERRITDTFVGTIKTQIWHADLAEREYWIAHTILPPIAAFFAFRSVVYDRASNNLMRELGGKPLRAIDRDEELLERELWYRLPARGDEPERIGRVGMRLVDETLVTVNASVPVGSEWILEGFFAYVQGVPGTRACQNRC